MKNRTEKRLHAVEAALLLALAVTAMWGAWSLQRQDALAEKTVRLHVIAHSDDPADQELKLLVRDRVLTMTEDVLRAGESTEQAMSELRRALPQLRQAAEEALRGAGCDLPVTALLENAEFPCKSYDGFALPAGEYPALRLVIGEGRGQNWWCVVYPPLCTAAAADFAATAESGGWSGDDVALARQENEPYRLRFRCIELWEELRVLLGKK